MADLDEAAARDIILAAASGTTTVVRAPAVPSPLQPGRLTVMMLALPLAAGAALIVHMVTDRSLAAALGLAIALAVGVTVPTARRLPRAARAAAARRARIGVLAGLVGLAAYDVSRVLLVVITGLETKPFKALPHFGHGLLGPGASDTAAWVAGAGYHVTNGIGFAVAYCIAVQRPSWRTGLAWALMLEALMIVFYPSWLQIEALKEFVTMSLFGHIAYGGTLGAVAAKPLRTSADTSRHLVLASGRSGIPLLAPSSPGRSGPRARLTAHPPGGRADS